MNERSPGKTNSFTAFIAIAVVVVYGLWHLTGAGAFAFGALCLAFAVWILSKIWNPLPKSFWWFCILVTCLGVVGLLLIKNTNV